MKISAKWHRDDDYIRDADGFILMDVRQGNRAGERLGDAVACFPKLLAAFRRFANRHPHLMSDVEEALLSSLSEIELPEEGKEGHPPVNPAPQGEQWEEYAFVVTDGCAGIVKLKKI